MAAGECVNHEEKTDTGRGIQRRPSRLLEMVDNVTQSISKSTINSSKVFQLAPPSEPSPRKDEKWKKSLERVKLPEKEFVMRQSPLTELLEVPHFKTIHHIFIASLILMLLHTMLSDLTETGTVDLGLERLMWALGEPQRTWTLIAGLHLTAIFVLYPAFHYWANARQTYQKDGQQMMDKIALGLFSTFVLAYVYLPGKYLWQQPLPFASGIIATMEQGRILMKMYAFVRSNIPRARKYKETSEDKNSSNFSKPVNGLVQPGVRLEDSGQAEASVQLRQRVSSAVVAKVIEDRPLTRGESWMKDTGKDEPCPDFTKYLYFLFAPTLVYKDSYPRTQKIRWDHVLWNFGQVVGCAFYANYILSRFCAMNFSKFGVPGHEMNLKQLLHTVFSFMLPGTLTLVLTFFMVLHTWQNAFAEMLYFGDRMFYKDWWNCSSFAVYYKTWNVLVHDWLYTYIFKDAWESGLGKKWKPLPTTLVFVVSSLFHEYIMCVSFHFFFPVVLVLFGFFGFAFVFIGNRKKSTPLGNILFWMAMMSGTGIIIASYSMEVYARANCPPPEDSPWNFFIPRTISCNAIKFQWD